MLGFTYKPARKHIEQWRLVSGSPDRQQQRRLPMLCIGQERGQVLYRRRRQESPGRHSASEGTFHFREHLSRKQRVPAAVEERVANSDTACFKGAAPETGQPLFDRRARRDINARAPAHGHGQFPDVPLSQLPPLDFAAGAGPDSRDRKNDAGYFEGRQTFREEMANVLRVQAGLAGYDQRGYILPQHFVRYRKDNGILNCRVFAKLLFDFFRSDFLPSPVYYFAQTSGQKKVAVGIEITTVRRAVPVAMKRTMAGTVVILIAREHAWSADYDLAGLSGLQRVTGFIEHRKIRPDADSH